MNRREAIGGVGASLLLVAGLPLASASRAAPALRWPNGRGGAVSLSYDDGLDCHLDLAMPALEQRGLKGTFYVTMRNIAHRLADWERVSSRGHELGDHTMSHPCDLRRFTPEQFARREIVPMESWLNVHAGRDRVPTFAYPCDVTNLGPGTPTVQANRYARLLAQPEGFLSGGPAQDGRRVLGRRRQREGSGEPDR
ncbi:MAG: polysaccharide deacetylase family protein [Janthinobacterium lividum]